VLTVHVYDPSKCVRSGTTACSLGCADALAT